MFGAGRASVYAYVCIRREERKILVEFFVVRVVDIYIMVEMMFFGEVRVFFFGNVGFVFLF